MGGSDGSGAEAGEFLPGQRWFAGKGRTIAGVAMRDAGALGLSWADVRYADGGAETYLLAPGDPAAALGLVAAIAEQRSAGGFDCHAVQPVPRVEPGAGIRPMGAEQSNTSLLVGDRLVLKLFRRLQAGPNPEMEVGRFLAAAGFPHIPPFYGWIEYAGATVAVLQGFLPNQGDGWKWTLGHFQDPDYFEAVRLLGRVTAQMHAALAGMEPAEPITEADAAGWERGVETDLARFPQLPAGALRERADGFRVLAGSPKIRVHGDYHLGQVLRVEDGFAVLDFEGEPGRPVAERRAKSSPLRDVAGMLRSFAYARHAIGADAGWEMNARRAFISGYGADPDPRPLAALELEKALYELRYELEHRPDWVAVPLAHLTDGGTAAGWPVEG